MSQSVLDLVENSLCAERESMALLLRERHAHLIKALALELETLKQKEAVPPSHALDPGRPPPAAGSADPNLSHVLVSGRVDVQPGTVEAASNKVDHTKAKQDEGMHGKGIKANEGRGKDDEPGQGDKFHNSRIAVGELLNNTKFETFIGCVIVLNSVLMGVETQLEMVGNDASIFSVLEHVFLACYTIELCMWFYAYGFSILCNNGWVAFDCLLVVFGIIGNYVIGPLAKNNDSLQSSLGGLLVMRMMRLFRLARILRLLVVFKVLWKLVRGLLGSAGTIGYTMGLIAVIVYMFACMAGELITKKLRDSEDKDVAAIVEMHFSTLPVTMLSLLQFVSIDGIADIYFPLVKADPVLMLFFLPFILIVSVSLMNLVTAVIVEGALEQGKQDREAMARYRNYEFKKMVPTLRGMFNEMDSDGDGHLTWDEFQSASAEIKEDLAEYMNESSHDMQELFEMLDVDDSGEVSVDEFCDGLAKLVHSDAPVEIIRVLKQLAIIRKNLDALGSRKSSVEGLGEFAI